MNLNLIDKARDSGDNDTARRCLAALAALVRDMTSQHGALPVDEPGASGGPANDPYSEYYQRRVKDPLPPERLALAPAIPATDAEVLARIRDILPGVSPAPVTPIDYDEIEARCDAAIARHLPLRPPPPSDFRLLVRLTGQWWRCLGRLVWSVFKSEKGGHRV